MNSTANTELFNAQGRELLQIGLGFLFQTLGVAQTKAAPAQFLAALGEDGHGLVVARGALLHLVLALGETVQRFAPLASAALGHLFFELGALALSLAQALFQLLHVLNRAAHLLKAALGLVHLPLKLWQQTLAVVAPPPLPGAQPLVRLGVGALLLTGGDDGADALFKLRAAGHADIALGDESAAAEHVL